MFSGVASPTAALNEYDRIAAVAVGPEELGIDKPDADCGLAGYHDDRVRWVNWVYDAMMLTSPVSLAAAASGSGSMMWPTLP